MLKRKPTAPRKAERDASTAERLRLARLEKYRHVNAKLKIELEKIKKSHVDLEEIRRIVQTENSKVKQRLNALPSSLALQVSGASPAAAEQLMRDGIRTALEGLALEVKEAES